jgi:hypothetical protein
LPSKSTLTQIYRRDDKREREVVDTERSFAEIALLSERLFSPEVPNPTTASRWIEIITLLLREGVISQNEIFHKLQRWSRSTISRDLDDLFRHGFVFESEFEGASQRCNWIVLDLSGRHRFYVANEKVMASADPLAEVRELRRRRRARADRQRRARRAGKPQIVTLCGPGPIIRHRAGARPRWLRQRPTWLAA